jgi:hypothetical protein
MLTPYVACCCQDLWPNVDVPMVFGGEELLPPVVPLKQADSIRSIKSELRIKSSKSHEASRSLKGQWLWLTRDFF